jgi:hypothetical protein
VHSPARGSTSTNDLYESNHPQGHQPCVHDTVPQSRYVSTSVVPALPFHLILSWFFASAATTTSSLILLLSQHHHSDLRINLLRRPPGSVLRSSLRRHRERRHHLHHQTALRLGNLQGHHCHGHSTRYQLGGLGIFDGASGNLPGYTFVGGNEEIVKKVLAYGYKHEGYNGIHDYIYDEQVLLIWTRDA